MLIFTFVILYKTFLSIKFLIFQWFLEDKSNKKNLRTIFLCYLLAKNLSFVVEVENMKCKTDALLVSLDLLILEQWLTQQKIVSFTEKY